MCFTAACVATNTARRFTATSAIEVGEDEVVERRHRGEARVVHQDVDAAELRGRALDGGDDRDRIGAVGTNRDRPAAELAYRTRRSLGLIGLCWT
jgi:hypothetical protein